MVLNLRDRQQTPAAPGLESQKVEEGGEHDFNILGKGQKVHRAKRQRAERCPAAEHLLGDGLFNCVWTTEIETKLPFTFPLQSRL